MEMFCCQRCGACCRKESVSGESRFFAHLFDFEASRLRKIAATLGIALRLKPFLVLQDAFSERGIVVFYEFDHGDCPFYDNGCRIYDSRPLVCRAFPVLRTEPFFASPACPAVAAVSGDPAVAFGSSFSACREMDSAAVMLKEKVASLAERGVLQLCNDRKFDELVDLSDFLKEHSGDSPVEY